MKKLFGIITIVAVLVMGIGSRDAISKVDHISYSTIMMHNAVTQDDAAEFLIAMAQCTDKLITFNIITNGGDAGTAVAIVAMMAEYKAAGYTFRTVTYGDAASAGAVIWMMGDERWVHERDLLMFHSVQFYNYRGEVIGDAALTPDQKKIKDIVNSVLRDVIIKATGNVKLAEKCLSNQAYYMTGREAYEVGLATHVVNSI